MLIDKQIPALIGGVSQQPATVRLPSQSEENINSWLSVSEGSRTRNPSEFAAKLSDDDLSGSYVHIINRDATERYVVIMDGTSIRVFDMQGTEKTVTTDAYADLTAFFATDAPGEGVSIGETFLLSAAGDISNGAFATAKDEDRTHGDAFKRTGASTVVFVAEHSDFTTALTATPVTVSGANLAAFFAGAGAGIFVDSLFRAATTSDTSDTAFATAKGSTPAVNDVFQRTGAASIIFVGSTADLTVAESHMIGVDAFGYLVCNSPNEDYVCVTVADYTFVLNRRVVVTLGGTDGTPGSSTSAQRAHQWTMIPRYDGEQVDTVAPMGLGAGGFRGQRARQNQYQPNPGGTLQGDVQTFQDLPDSASTGDIYRIKATADTGFAEYYVRSAGNNTWNECVKPGLRNRIDATTMPHALVRKADGTFEFGPFSWADRRVGDETTNPNPSFVAREIRDIFWYKNRFGVAVDEGVCLTRVGDFGNFYRLTVTDVLDDDRIDVQASETKVTKINYAVPFDGSIMLFSDQTQMRLTHGSEGMTPGNCTLDPVTNFKMISNVRPYSLGSDVYFAAENGDYATLREYYVAPDTQVNDAANITGHVPRYVPAGIRRISGSDQHNLLMAITGVDEDAGSTNSNNIYCYQFYWASESEKAQSAWHRWDFSADNELIAAEVLDNFIVVVTARADGTYLETLDLQHSGPNSHCLDRLAAPTVEFDGDTGTFTLPYAVAAAHRASFRIQVGDKLLANVPSAYTWNSATEVEVEDVPAGVFKCGLLYTFRHEFSEQFARNQQDIPLLNGKLLLRNWTVYFQDTAYFETEVAPYGQANPTPEPVIPALTAAGQKQTQTLSYFVANNPSFLKGQHSFGVYGESSEAIVAIRATSPYSVTLTQAEYEGFYQKRSRTI